MGYNKNSGLNIRDDVYTGICPKCGKQATITVHTIVRKRCSTDLQKTYTQAGGQCSILSRQWDLCLDSCPLVANKY